MSLPLLATSRKEFDGVLNVVDGKLPDDIYGIFFACYPVGSVNSDGLPFPEETPDGEYNREYGSPIMNGDGMVMRIDFNAEHGPELMLRIMKPPCYYADYHSRYGTEEHKIFGFKNFGISRMSLTLGARNELNTAIQPVRFKDNEPVTMLSTYDVGRPFLVDAKNLELLSPLGWSREYTDTQPGMVPWPFGVVESTAHPCFDPNTKELFLVNYTRNTQAFVKDEKTIHHLKKNHDSLHDKLHKLAEHLHENVEKHEAVSKVKHFFNHLHHVIRGDKWEDLAEQPDSGDSTVFLMKWDGEGDLHKWLLKDQNGKSLEIKECMHQMGMTKDYIILTDCSFKFSTDLMVNNPFPHNEKIDAFMRWMLSIPMEPYTTTYIVKRSDLDGRKKEVVAIKLDKPIPVETIHYSMNYANPDGKITMLGIHNSAVCVAEWLRAYDTEALSRKSINKEVISLFAIGSMDLSRLGKWVIDAENGKLLEDESSEYVEAGSLNDEDHGPNSWSIGLYTHRDIISADVAPETIPYVWYVANGTDPRMLSTFIFNLYRDYPNRILSEKDVLKYTAANLPFALVRIDTETMKPGDYYQCPAKTYIRSIQFVNRSLRNTDLPLELDGYLVCTVQAGHTVVGQGTQYKSQIWVFEADNVSKGPICKMEHPDLLFCFTLHSAWIPEATYSPMEYRVDVKQDYTEVLDNIIDKALLEPFFDKYVYPYFNPEA